MNKHIFKIFSLLGSQAIIVFPYQTAWQYSEGSPPNWYIECRCGRHKSRSLWYSWLSIDDVLDLSTRSATIHRAVYHTYGNASVKLYGIYHSLQHARLWRREENRTVCTQRQIWSGTWTRCIVLLKLMIDTKHRSASLRQQSYLLLIHLSLFELINYWMCLFNSSTVIWLCQ